MSNVSVILLLYVAIISIAFNVKQYFSHKVWVASVSSRIGEAMATKLGLRSGFAADQREYEGAPADK